MKNRPTVLLSEPIADAALSRLRAVAELRISPATDHVTLTREIADTDAFIVRSTTVDGDLLAAGRRLRVVGRHGAGLENIDLGAATRLGIPVVHTPGANAEAVGDFAVLVTELLLRRIPQAVAALGAGELSSGSLPGQVQAAGLVGTGLRGRTLGLAGLGAIGRATATAAIARGMRVVAYDPAALTPPPGVTALELDEVLARSDAVSLHVPLTPATKGLLDAARLNLLRPGAVVVNTSRANVVDESAILSALAEGHVGGYAVDVFDPEPPAPSHPFLNHPLVLATPHMAAMSAEGLLAMSHSVVDSVLAVLHGEAPRHLANPELVTTSFGVGGTR